MGLFPITIGKHPLADLATMRVMHGIDQVLQVVIQPVELPHHERIACVPLVAGELGDHEHERESLRQYYPWPCCQIGTIHVAKKVNARND
jgi:hypothetical protein